MRTYRRNEALLARESYCVAVLNSIVQRSADSNMPKALFRRLVYREEAVRQDRAGRSLGAAEARSSYPNLRPDLKYMPKRAQKALLILNADFAVPNGTAAGRNFAPRRPALRVRICVRLRVSFASSGTNLHIYPMPQASLKF